MSQTENNDLKNKVEKALEEIRPFLGADGGDISIEDIDMDNNVVIVRLHGACKSCSMSTMTMKTGVEEAIKRIAPEVTSVKAINMPDPKKATPFGK